MKSNITFIRLLCVFTALAFALCAFSACDAQERETNEYTNVPVEDVMEYFSDVLAELDGIENRELRAETKEYALRYLLSRYLTTDFNEENEDERLKMEQYIRERELGLLVSSDSDDAEIYQELKDEFEAYENKYAEFSKHPEETEAKSLIVKE